MRAVLASHNKKKMKEMREILAQLGVEVISQAEAGVDIEPEETGTTFEENARIKARAIMEATGLRTLSYEEALAYTRGITVEDLRKGYKSTKTTPLGRSGRLTEVADTVMFLASERAGYIHGVTYNIAGGKTRG